MYNCNVLEKNESETRMTAAKYTSALLTVCCLFVCVCVAATEQQSRLCQMEEDDATQDRPSGQRCYLSARRTRPDTVGEVRTNHYSVSPVTSLQEHFLLKGFSQSIYKNTYWSDWSDMSTVPSSNDMSFQKIVESLPSCQETQNRTGLKKIKTFTNKTW